MEERWRFIADNDGHDYIIPSHKEREFWEWVEAVENYNDWGGTDFEQYVCSSAPGCYTFTDPRVES